MVRLSLYINYFVFAILLNSVGIVILKAQNVYGVDELQASILEAFKDMPIAIVSFLIASFLPRIGYKKAMLFALGLVTFACIYMYYGNSFVAAKVLFASVGASFALIKVSVYSVIGLVTEDEKGHNSLMSFLSMIFLLFTKFDQDYEIPGVNLLDDISEMLKLLIKILVLIFVIAAFLFVMIEQGIMTWLPTFNERVLDLPEFVLPRTVNADIGEISALSDVPLIGFAFPLVGLFIAPIYPLLNSAVLSALPQKLHSAMTGLIVIFSAIGGTLGSRAIGYLFKNVGADTAFYYTHE